MACIFSNFARTLALAASEQNMRVHQQERSRRQSTTTAHVWKYTYEDFAVASAPAASRECIASAWPLCAATIKGETLAPSAAMSFPVFGSLQNSKNMSDVIHGPKTTHSRTRLLTAFTSAPAEISSRTTSMLPSWTAMIIGINV